MNQGFDYCVDFEDEPQVWVFGVRLRSGKAT
jgi:hypothetical protein